MSAKRFKALWKACLDFYNFAPHKVILCFGLMLLQGITAGIGLLLLIPLLQLIGMDLAGGASQDFAQALARIFQTFNIPLNLESVLISYVLLVSFISGLKYWVAVLSVQLQQHYVSQNRDKLFRALLHSHWSFITAHRMSDFIHSLTTQVQKLGLITQKLLSLFSQLIVTLVYVVLALLLSWQMSLLALACASVLFMILLPLNRRIYRSGEEQLFAFKDIFRMLNEQLASLKMIKSYASEDYYAAQMDGVGRHMEAQSIQLTKINGIPQLIYSMGAVLAFSVLFYISLTVLHVSLATLLLLLLIFSRLLPQVSSIQTSIQQLIHNIPAFEDVSTMMQDCQNAAESDQKITVDAPLIQQAIHVRNLTFCYPNQQKPIIQQLNFDIKLNKTIAFVGASGVGKSTLADLIAGLLKPSDGQILCDEQNLIGDYRLAWRRHIAYVTQEVYLFHASVRENLVWVSDAKVSDQQIWNGLALAAAKGFVEKLPQGLDTIIGDRGIRLSGGERQRLALARALLSNPRLLILDEATSALDHDNEVRIQQALEQLQGRLTIILIAHRQTTLEHADQVIHLD